MHEGSMRGIQALQPQGGIRDVRLGLRHRNNGGGRRLRLHGLFSKDIGQQRRDFVRVVLQRGDASGIELESSRCRFGRDRGCGLKGRRSKGSGRCRMNVPENLLGVHAQYLVDLLQHLDFCGRDGSIRLGHRHHELRNGLLRGRGKRLQLLLERRKRGRRSHQVSQVRAQPLLVRRRQMCPALNVLP